MPRSEATTVDAGGREVRVSNPDRVIFPPGERSAAVTKLGVVEYYLAVGEGIMRAVHRRPTTLERWPKGVHEGIVLATREKGGGDAFYQKRVPRGAPDFVGTARIQFPSGRHADEICPSEIAVVAWAAQMGTITFHPWPVRADDVEHPDELRIDLDPQPGTDFADAVRVAGELATAAGAKRVVPLNVSGAWHSVLMDPARDEFARHIADAAVMLPRFAVISNVASSRTSTARGAWRSTGFAGARATRRTCRRRR